MSGCGVNSFGRSQWQHLLSTSELRLQQEPEVSAVPGNKVAPTLCKGQGHLMLLEMYPFLIFFFRNFYKYKDFVITVFANFSQLKQPSDP